MEGGREKGEVAILVRGEWREGRGRRSDICGRREWGEVAIPMRGE